MGDHFVPEWVIRMGRNTHCNRGKDVIKGGPGDDTLYGNRGHDTLKGGGGHDSAYGGRGTDYCRNVESTVRSCETW